MSVLAFLQNAYTTDEESAKRIEAFFANPKFVDYAQERRREGLFDGRNYTGLTLKRILGERVCHSIWWENASPRWGWRSDHKFPADLVHIRQLCEDRQPSIVLTFGKVATDALSDLAKLPDSPIRDALLLSAPHPAARNPDKYRLLRDLGSRLIDAAQFAECPHCQLLTVGHSHCDHCHKPVRIEVANA